MARGGGAPPKNGWAVVGLIASIAGPIIAMAALAVTLMKDDRSERDSLLQRLTVIECRLKITEACR